MAELNLMLIGLIPIGYCAYTDIKTGKIKNIVTFPAMIIFLGLIAITNSNELLESVKWGLIAWGIVIPAILMDLVKGGDGKLIALCGIIYKSQVIEVIIYFLIICLVWFIVRDSIYNKSLWKTLRSLLLFKNFTNKNKRYNLGGLFIFLACVSKIVKELILWVV